MCGLDPSMPILGQRPLPTYSGLRLKNMDQVNAGYGQFCVGARNMLAHRVAYELSIGPIPENYYLDHLCRVRDCVNPAHLEPVTLRQNVLRGVGITALNALKTHCNRGHPFNEENTRITQEGDRECIACRRNTLRRFRNKLSTERI